MKKIIYFTNSSWTLYNFRISNMKYLLKKGYEVIAIGSTNSEYYYSKFDKLGIKYYYIKMNTRIGNPFTNILNILKLVFIFFKEGPSLIHSFSNKPILFTIISRLFYNKNKYVFTFTGLGYLFSTKKSLTRTVFIFFLKLIKSKTKYTFQNKSDLLSLNNFLDKKASYLIEGSGINTKKFVYHKKSNKQIQFLCYGRMLWSKGIAYYIDAAKILLNKYDNINFLLIGGTGKNNSDKIDAEWIANPDQIPGEWLENNTNFFGFNWLHHQENIIKYINQSDVFVYPTFYNEGLPRSILECMSSGLPVITTNTPGCKDIVEHNFNGKISSQKSSKELAQHMEYFITEKHQIFIYGQNARDSILKKYSDEVINDKYVNLYRSLAND